MPVKKITFYYDVVSPYSWIAFEVLTRYEGIWKVPIDYTPFFLGGVMQTTGNVPPVSNPYKGNYLFKGVCASFPMLAMKHALNFLTLVRHSAQCKSLPSSSFYAFKVPREHD